jgi:hypothetical protein
MFFRGDDKDTLKEEGKTYQMVQSSPHNWTIIFSHLHIYSLWAKPHIRFIFVTLINMRYSMNLTHVPRRVNLMLEGTPANAAWERLLAGVHAEVLCNVG